MSELRVLPPNLREETELGKGAAGCNDQEYKHWNSVQRTQAHLCHFSFELVFSGKNKRSNMFNEEQAISTGHPGIWLMHNKWQLLLLSLLLLLLRGHPAQILGGNGKMQPKKFSFSQPCALNLFPQDKSTQST